MRILYLLTCLGIGGAEKQVIDIAESMAANGHTVALIALKHSDTEWPVKLPVLRLNIRKTPAGIARGLRFAANFMALFGPQVLHSHTYAANIFARMLRITHRNASPRIVNTIHNVYEGGWHRMMLYRATDPFVDRVTAVSQAAADRFIHLHAVSSRKMHVLTNGIDTDAFTPDRARRRRIRAQMAASGEFIWLAVGRLVPAKDYPNLLRAFAQVRAAHPTARLWIAGEGELPVAANNPEVELLGLRRDIVDLLEAADAYVLSSAWEGLPLSLAEAMAMEKPVVATDVGGVRELVGEAGVIVPPHDSSALAQAMLKAMVLRNQEARSIGNAARNRIVEHFSLRAKAVEWEQFYTQLMQERAA